MTEPYLHMEMAIYNKAKGFKMQLAERKQRPG